MMDPEELTKFYINVDELAEETGGFTIQDLIRGGINLEASEFTSIARSSNRLNQSVNVGKVEETLAKWASELDAVNMEKPEYDQRNLLLGPLKLVRLGGRTANRMFDTMLKRIRVEFALEQTQGYLKAGYSKEEVTQRFLPEITDLANNMTGTGFTDRRYGNAIDLARIALYAPRYL